MIVLRVPLLEVDTALFHLEHADIALMARPIVIVLHVACLGTLAAADADTQVEGVGK